MKKIYVSELCGWDESAERMYVYELENQEEYDELDDMSHDELCELFNVFDYSGYNVMPGARYYTYDFHLSGGFITMYETVSLNV